MKRKYVILGIVAFIILIAAITNPNEDKHKSTVKAKVLSLMQEKQAAEMKTEDNVFAQAGIGLGSMLGGAIVEQVVNSCVSSNNYVLFSLTKITWNGDTRIIGIGAFGNVFLTDKIDEALKSGLAGNEQEKIKMDAEKAKMDSLFNAAAVDVPTGDEK